MEEGEFQLKTGRSCQLKRIRNELIPKYYILLFPSSQGEPTAEEVSEMLVEGIEAAKKLAKYHRGDEQAFTLLYSGYSARREKGWHVHIILLGSRWRKAWLYIALTGKKRAAGDWRPQR